VPTWVITTPDDAALRGADRALDDRLAQDAEAAGPRRST